MDASPVAMPYREVAPQNPRGVRCSEESSTHHTQDDAMHPFVPPLSLAPPPAAVIHEAGNGVKAAQSPLPLGTVAEDLGGLGLPPVLHSAAPIAGQSVSRVPQ
jgi:hypothetical protein